MIEESKIGQSPEIMIKEGLRSYPMPELGVKPDHALEVSPPSPEDAQQRIDDILCSIESQGGQLVGVIPVGCTVPTRRGYTQEQRNFLIIKK